MSKMMKKLISVVLAVVLVLSAVTVVSAASDSNDEGYYTMVMENTTTGEVRDVVAQAGDRYDTMSAYFYGMENGTYNIMVYYFNSEGGNNSLCASTQWNCEVQNDETADLRLDYYLVTEEIGIELIEINSGTSDNDGYKIVMRNVDTEETFEETAQPDELYDTVSAYFDAVPGGTYDVVVYTFNEEGGNTSLCASTQWTCEAAEGEVDTVKVSYYTVVSEIGIEVTAVHPGTPENDGYKIVMRNVDTEETFEETAQPDELHDTVSAYFDAVPGGTYDIVVYTFNEEGGNTSLCASTQWTCEAGEGEVDTVKVSYYTVVSEIGVEITAVHHPDETYTVILENTDTGNTISMDMIIDDLKPGSYYRIVEGLEHGNYKISIAYSDVVLATTNWNCTINDHDGTEAIEVTYDAVTNEIGILDLGKTVVEPEPDNTDATSATGNSSTNNTATSDTSTNDTASNNSAVSGGAVQTGSAQAAAVILLVLISAVATVYFTRKYRA